MGKLHSIDNNSGRCKTMAMSPKQLEPGTPTERVQIIAPQTWIQRIDQWRRKQEDHIPSRSEAIRILVDQALNKE